MSGKGGGNLSRFAELSQQIAHEAQVLSLPELIEHVVHHSGLLEHYQNDREGADRLENLQELVNAGAAFVAEANFRSAERRVGKECVNTCRSRWSPYP